MNLLNSIEYYSNSTILLHIMIIVDAELIWLACACIYVCARAKSSDPSSIRIKLSVASKMKWFNREQHFDNRKCTRIIFIVDYFEQNSRRHEAGNCSNESEFKWSFLKNNLIIDEFIFLCPLFVKKWLKGGFGNVVTST